MPAMDVIHTLYSGGGLIGGKRGGQFQVRFRDEADFDMTLPWRRGDTLQTTLGHLATIQQPGALHARPCCRVQHGKVTHRQTEKVRPA